MVWIKFREKFGGRILPGTFAKKYKTRVKAKSFVRKWNSLTGRDHLYVVGMSRKKPQNFSRTKYSGIYKKTK